MSAIPYAIASQDARRTDYEQVETSLSLPNSMQISDLKKVSVYQVEDGDTIEAVIDGQVWPVRLYGVDTPERGEACYREARDRLIRLAAGKVHLLEDSRNQDEFGRLLRYVFLPDGTSVDATLVAEGFAHAWRDDGRYREDLLELETQARDAGRGCLWATEE